MGLPCNPCGLDDAIVALEGPATKSASSKPSEPSSLGVGGGRRRTPAGGGPHGRDPRCGSGAREVHSQIALIALDAQLPECMSGFVDAAACRTWGGPAIVAFGQYYLGIGRCHLNTFCPAYTLKCEAPYVIWQTAFRRVQHRPIDCESSRRNVGPIAPMTAAMQLYKLTRSTRSVRGLNITEGTRR
jgi:hypothetical protein